ncbi:Bax inhibitor-1/YccA family protein [Pelagibaculum spongiae]|uniref:BAX inhibitor protein n=1 Tax=Pelagibaculum spongiae TaxID=2080658 RepID=A0A2V1H3W4_9GAMM|nr:Bax inhibitor-1/YccA family protein [Pelagibaculum spongiae]PVZ71475.1 BAX inhibitor protein [Pelagibaculum spongiae]
MQEQAISHAGGSALATNRVLRNTYFLLGLTLLFSGMVAGVAMALNLPHPGFIITLVGFYGLLYLTHKTAESAAGIASVFALTGFMGYTLGPMINMVIQAGGSEIVMTAMAGTGAIFVVLSAIALTTKKDFSFLGKFMMVGFFVLILGMVANIFLNIPALQLAISAGFILFSSAAILYQTGEIINGGERNYILATVTLFVSIYNIFVSLMSILMALSGNDD